MQNKSEDVFPYLNGRCIYLVGEYLIDEDVNSQLGVYVKQLFFCFCGDLTFETVFPQE